MHRFLSCVALSGVCAGTVNGLLGAGGGMLLVPLLTTCSDIEESQIFPSSVAIILPICIVSLMFTKNIPWAMALPYMLGSLLGGIAAGIMGKRIPTLWLHKVLGAFILWGGVRYLWQTL